MFHMKNTPEDKYIEVDGKRLHYIEWGVRSWTTMLLLHGIGDDAHVWDHFALGAAGKFRIIALDQRGHGLSDWVTPPAYSCRDYVSDIENLVEALQLKKIILIGHSMGALHATRYASQVPGKTAALIHADIDPCPPEWNKKYLTNLYERLPEFYTSVREYVEELRQNSPYAEESLLYRLAAFALTECENGKLRLRYDREVLRHFDHYDLRPYLKDIRCPVLIMRGQESRVMSAEVAREMSAMINQGRFTEIPKATHPLHTDNPLEFQRVVMAFLDELCHSGLTGI